MIRRATTQRSLRFALAFALTAVSGPSVAAACPEARPAPQIVFSAAGPLAQTDEAIVRFADDGGATVVGDEDASRSLVGFSPDGQRLVSSTPVRIDAEGGRPCVFTHVWIRMFDLSAGTSRRLARLSATAARSVSFSPSGRFVAIGVNDPEDTPRLHVFDLDRGRRQYVIDGVEATWLDDTQFLVRDRRARLSLHRNRDGERVRVLAPPARRLRPYTAGADATGFWASARSGREKQLVRVHLEGSRVRIEASPVALPERPSTVSMDGSRGAWAGRGDGESLVRIYDLNDGSIIATIRGRPSYDAVGLSPDGAKALVVSGSVVELIPLDGGSKTSWGSPHPPSELILRENLPSDDTGAE